MPIMGEFDLTGTNIVFKGQKLPVETSQSQPPPEPGAPEDFIATVGILLSDQKIINGTLRASVVFSEVTPHSACELIISHDLRTTAQISTGLGGSRAMFSIREWKPAGSVQQTGGAWQNHRLTGDRANIKPDRTYEIAATVNGSEVTLEVDGVQVITANVPAINAQPHQVGLFFVSGTPVTVTEFSAESERPTAFIVMQFTSPYNEVYSHVIKAACEEFDVEPVRADEIYGPGIIIKDVVDRIAKSQLIIADISPTNPNVYFEVGYALALGKPIILLAQRPQPGAALPFDLSSFRVLFYDDSIGGKPKLETGLRNHLREILGAS